MSPEAIEAMQELAEKAAARAVINKQKRDAVIAGIDAATDYKMLAASYVTFIEAFDCFDDEQRHQAESRALLKEKQLELEFQIEWARKTDAVRDAQMDAATAEGRYWELRARKEGLK